MKHTEKLPQIECVGLMPQTKGISKNQATVITYHFS
jgi:hypothetical protein